MTDIRNAIWSTIRQSSPSDLAPVGAVASWSVKGDDHNGLSIFYSDVDDILELSLTERVNDEPVNVLLMTVDLLAEPPAVHITSESSALEFSGTAADASHPALQASLSHVREVLRAA